MKKTSRIPGRMFAARMLKIRLVLLLFFTVLFFSLPGSASATSPPSSVAASDGTSTSYVAVSWSSVFLATSYRVYRSTTTTSAGSLIATTSSTSFNDTGAVPGQQYYYRVSAYALLLGGWSGVSGYNPGYRAMLPPAGVSASDGTSTGWVSVSWSAAYGANLYYVYRSTSSSGALTYLGSTSATAFNDTGATPGVYYYYWVRSRGISGYTSGYSSYNIGYRALVAPAPSASDGTSSSWVSISWSAVTGAANYYVYRSETLEGTKTYLGSTTLTNFNDTGAVPGTIYYYWLRSRASSGILSAYSSYNTGYRALLPPSTVTATDGTYTDRVTVTWSTVTGANLYYVYRSDTSTGGKTTLGSSATTTFNDSTAVPGKTYLYWVRSRSPQSVYSAYSAYNTGYRAMTVPDGVTATDGTYTDKVTVSWSSVTRVNNIYYVYRATSVTGTGQTLLGTTPYTSLTLDDTTGNPGQIYYYQVRGRSVSAIDIGTFYTYTPYSSYNGGYRGLVEPAGVSATDGTYTDKVTVSWSAVAGADLYQIWRSDTLGGTKTSMGTTTGTTYDNTSANPGQIYYYWVRARSSDGVYSPFGTSDTGHRALLAPTGVSATDGTHTDKTVVSWSSVTGANEYDVLRANTPAGVKSQLGSTASLTYDDTVGTPGQKYYYWVRAKSSSGVIGTFSAYDVGYKAMLDPTGVSATDGAYTDKVTIDWSAVTGADHYEVYRTDDATCCASATVIGSPAALTIDDTTATAGQTYYYWIRAVSSSDTYSSMSGDTGFMAIKKAELIVDFGSSNGLWAKYNNAGWTKLHMFSPALTTAGNLDGTGDDEEIAVFPSYGLYARYNNAGPWVRLHSIDPDMVVTGDMDGSGEDEIVAVFASYGVYARYNNAGGWVRLTPLVPEQILLADLDGDGKDEMIGDFGLPLGIWGKYNNGAWQKIMQAEAGPMTAGDLDGNGQDELIVHFPAYNGIWVKHNNAGWTKLHVLAPQSMVTGDIDGSGGDDIAIDFGTINGVWVWYDNDTWSKRHSLSPDSMTIGDLDGSGEYDLVADFGSLGIHAMYNNSAWWLSIHTFNPEYMNTGSLDAN